MLDYILAADLFLITLILGNLSWHCNHWRKTMPPVAEVAGNTTTEIVAIMNECGAILADIAELLEGGPTASPTASPSPPIDLPQIFLNLLMNKAEMAMEHGKTNQDGPLHESELPTPQKQVQESD